MSRSPSQWPGTARSSASAGRSLIITSGVTCAHALLPGPARGTRSARPVRRHDDQLTLQRTAAFDVERLVDRLVADPHGLIIGEIDAEAGAICSGLHASHPGPVTAMRLVAALPARAGRADDLPSAPRTTARRGGPGRNRAAARWRRASRSWAAGQPLGLPLRDRCPILELVATGRSVTAQLPRDRRRGPPDPRAISRTPALSAQQTRSPPARRRQVTARNGLADVGSRRQHDGTNGTRPAATHPHHPRRPRSSAPARSAAQNRTRSCRQATVGRPGEGIWPR